MTHAPRLVQTGFPSRAGGRPSLHVTRTAIIRSGGQTGAGFTLARGIGLHRTGASPRGCYAPCLCLAPRRHQRHTLPPHWGDVWPGWTDTCLPLATHPTARCLSPTMQYRDRRPGSLQRYLLTTQMRALGLKLQLTTGELPPLQAARQCSDPSPSCHAPPCPKKVGGCWTPPSMPTPSAQVLTWKSTSVCCRFIVLREVSSWHPVLSKSAGFHAAAAAARGTQSVRCLNHFADR